MTTRRTFLTRLASTVAAIALAPQLCRMGAQHVMGFDVAEDELVWTDVHLELDGDGKPIFRILTSHQLVIASKPLHPEFGITVRHVKS